MQWVLLIVVGLIIGFAGFAVGFSLGQESERNVHGFASRKDDRTMEG